MQCLMIFFTGQRNYLFNLVKVKCTDAVNVMQEDATVGKKLWYLDKILFVEWFQVQVVHGLWRQQAAFPVWDVFSVSKESTTCHTKRRTCV